MPTTGNSAVWMKVRLRIATSELNDLCQRSQLRQHAIRREQPRLRMLRERLHLDLQVCDTKRAADVQAVATAFEPWIAEDGHADLIQIAGRQPERCNEVHILRKGAHGLHAVALEYTLRRRIG